MVVDTSLRYVRLGLLADWVAVLMESGFGE